MFTTSALSLGVVVFLLIISIVVGLAVARKRGKFIVFFTDVLILIL